MGHSRWNLLPSVPANHLINTSGLPLLITQLLYNRGLAEPSQMEPFLNADERLSGDPARLSGMHQAIARIYQALLSGENIAVYGDFDTDGTIDDSSGAQVTHTYADSGIYTVTL